MFSTRSEYDRGVNTFSPEGRLFQVEYALGTIKLGSTALGICTKEGVIIASERRITSNLLESDSVQKILVLDEHCCAAMSGLMADAQTLVDHARVHCAHHRFVYNERLSIQSTVECIGARALDFADASSGQRKKTMSRPFGVALLVAGSDSDGTHLWCTDPSGTNTKYEAGAVGSAQEGAEAMLQEQYRPDMTFSEAEVLALSTLRQVMEEKLTSANIEMAFAKGENSTCRLYTREEKEALIAQLPHADLVDGSGLPPAVEQEMGAAPAA